MLYTTYLAKAKFLPDHIKKYLIVRWLPAGLNPEKSNFIWKPELSPEDRLLSSYKKGEISWPKFVGDFVCQISDNNNAIRTMYEIINEVENGVDVALICVEKDYEHCHRSITAQDICNLSNGKIPGWKEYKFN